MRHSRRWMVALVALGVVVAAVAGGSAQAFSDSRPRLPLESAGGVMNPVAVPKSNEPERAELAGLASAAFTRPAPARPAAAPDPTRKAHWTPQSRTCTTEQFPVVIDRLASTQSAAEFLQLMRCLCGDVQRVGPAVPNSPDAEEAGTKDVYRESEWSTRFHRDPDLMAPLLFQAFKQSRVGVARQLLIFHAALALPERLAFPWLRELAAAGDADDRDDAICALAFRGDDSAIAKFVEQSRQPAPAHVHRWLDGRETLDALGKAGERGVLRSYRCIETLEREPYFKMDAEYYDGLREPFLWSRPAGVATVKLVERLVPAWMARYPNHPGSDDMALWLARLARAHGDYPAAATWALRGAAWPDQDVSTSLRTEAIEIVEIEMSVDELGRFIGDGAASEPNREFLNYVWLRRMAVTAGFDEAISAAQALANREPNSAVALAWRGRWAEPAPKGLDSGATPLPATDMLRHVEGERASDEPLIDGAWNWSVNVSTRQSGLDGDAAPNCYTAALEPDREQLRPSLRRMAGQFRLWCTLAELERRQSDLACETEAWADLQYKRAAVFYHQRDTVHRVYARWYDQLPGGDQTSSYLRAVEAFEQLREKSPTYSAMDKVEFSIAMAHYHESDHGRDMHQIELAMDAFKRLLRDHPASPLGADAAAAVEYWRRRGY